MAELADQVLLGERPAEGGYGVRFAWIGVLLRRRAVEALSYLQLQAGDVVSSGGGGPEESDLVSSIGADGRVYFRGPNCRSGLPHALRVVVRAGDLTPNKHGARNAAAHSVGLGDQSNAR